MEKYISWNLWAVRVIGVWHPDGISSALLKISVFLRSLTISSILFILLPAAIAAPSHLHRRDLSMSVEILALSLSSSIVLYKTVNLVLQRYRVRNLLDTMSEFWRETKGDEIEAIERFAKIGKRATQFYFTLGLFNIATFVAQPFLTSYLNPTVTVGNCTASYLNQLPFNGWEDFLDSETTSIFVVLFVCHVVAGAAATVASVGHDCLFAVLILHVCGNLRAIAVRLSSLEFSGEDPQGEELEVLRCGKKLQSLIDYTTQLEKIVSQFLLIQTLQSTVTICLTGFMMSRNILVNKELGKYFFYWAAALFQLFIFCWTGNYLQTETNFVGQSAYDAYGKLMNLSPKNQRHRHLIARIPRYLRMILLRSQTPINISAGGFYAASLENYKNILSTSYSYFTILRAFAENKT